MKLAVLAAVAALAFASPAAHAVTLKLGHNAAPGNPKDEASLFFAKRVGELSGGKITVQVGGNSQFGDDAEMLTGLRLGTLDISANSQGPTAGIVPQFGVIGLPFLFKTLPAAWQVLDGPIGDELKTEAEKKNLVVLAFWDNGIRHISNNVRPITKPDDLKGLKIRTPPDPATIDTFAALGANPTPMKFSELYLALQQGVVDGQENPLMNIYSSKLFEVQKYLSLTGHKYEMTVFLMSKPVWAKLSADDKKIIQQAATEARDLNRKLSAASDESLRGKIEAAGVKFNDVDTAPFQAMVKPVYEKWTKEQGDFVGRVQAAAKAAGM
ncbi:DctP family TRAP transporter solute-binding subunit [Xanthobacter sp. KR7-65]|uniref:TRAP transporter substrate-binding protein n=1 Tax=Xanthobacter sp. KR7-65 TaxID=3156612 RepID=UPI0032B50AD6